MLRHTQSQLFISKDFLHDHEIVIGYTDNINLDNLAADLVNECGMSDERVPPSGISMTALQRRNEELAAALTEARSADRARTTFFAMVTHEMRTPLNAITGFSDAALHGVHGPLPEAYRSYFSAIHGVGQHLESLVDTLLDLAQLEAGRFTIEQRPVSARLAVADARAMVVSLAEGRASISAPSPSPATGCCWSTRRGSGRSSSIFSRTPSSSRRAAAGSASTPGRRPPDLSTSRSGIPGSASRRTSRSGSSRRSIRSAGRRRAAPKASGSACDLAAARPGHGRRHPLASEPGKGSRFTARLPLLPETAPAA